ncbi:hypothetical protein TIFTF001_042732 [Ficus carica]|uniref:Protein kinase domain-containing protein n=1 Tax=Ficus carica TaxID=3494 RepID=A0AA87ZQ28_FICCA|nr:hypothetical protein TIFTF001_042732 [Ficus carica]
MAEHQLVLVLIPRLLLRPNLPRHLQPNFPNLNPEALLPKKQRFDPRNLSRLWRAASREPDSPRLLQPARQRHKQHHRDGVHVLQVQVPDKNVFASVGCDTLGVVGGGARGRNYTSGCLSLCEEVNDMVNGSCSGVGCCQMSIPEDVVDFAISVGSLYGHEKVWEFDECGYAFVVEDLSYNFSTADLRGLESRETVPVVLDWAVGNLTCREAKENNNVTAFACRASKSDCVDSSNGSGYRCICMDGFEGNPYLLHGCQGISIGLLLFLLAGSWIYWWLKKRKLIKLKEKFFEQNGGLLLQQLVHQRGSSETAKIFSAEQLKKATNNYDESRVLGQGGYGTVYKGVLPDNKVVAIKKSKLVAKVKLSKVPLLVYEFITNGTLSDHIHDDQRDQYHSSLSWERRLKIAAETAGAIAYLHSSTSMPIIHRDIKTTNILLDENYAAKVSDFGASRLVPLDQTQLTTLVQGTLGYLDPEYFQTSQLTEKSDVYSFGVVLAELLTGQKALSFDRGEGDRNLAMCFISSMKEDQLLQVLDQSLVQEGKIEQIKVVAKLAKCCLRVRGEERPTMKEVASELEGLVRYKGGTHPWGQDDHDLISSEETEFLLKPSDPYNLDDQVNIDIGGTSGSIATAGFDSMSIQILMPCDNDDGR